MEWQFEAFGRSVPSYQDLFTNIIIVQYFLWGFRLTFTQISHKIFFRKCSSILWEIWVNDIRTFLSYVLLCPEGVSTRIEFTRHYNGTAGGCLNEYTEGKFLPRLALVMEL